MRILLVGPPADRARLRVQLAGAGIDIVGEIPDLESARGSFADFDAVVLATTAVLRPNRPSRNLLGPDRTSRAAAGGGEELLEPLTARERQVLDLLAEGLPNKTIAVRLSISDQTVKFHVASICGKLGAANRTEAVRRAVRRGLITL